MYDYLAALELRLFATLMIPMEGPYNDMFAPQKAQIALAVGQKWRRLNLITNVYEEDRRIAVIRPDTRLFKGKSGLVAFFSDGGRVSIENGCLAHVSPRLYGPWEFVGAVPTREPLPVVLVYGFGGSESPNDAETDRWAAMVEVLRETESV